MEGRIANNIDELIKFWKDDVTSENIEVDTGHFVLEHTDEGLNNINVAFELNLPFSSKFHNKMESTIHENISTLNFKNCTFLHDVYIGRMNQNIQFTEK